jgi:hypothetical protein
VPSVAYANLNLSYTPDQAKRLQFYFNIQDLWDRKPPPAASFSAETQPGQFGGWAIGDDPIRPLLQARVRYRQRRPEPSRLQRSSLSSGCARRAAVLLCGPQLAGLCSLLGRQEDRLR